MEKIFIAYYNNVHMLVTASDRGIEKELSEYFKFRVPGFQFMPSYKKGFFDGFIRLYNTKTNLIYCGLLEKILFFCEKHGYEAVVDSKLTEKNEFTKEDALDFILSIDLPDKFEIRDYQVDSFVEAINQKRLTILSPTASGKSLMIYLVARYLQLKTLIIVPTTNLVHQLSGDFEDYGYNKEIHKIYSGKDKNSDKKFNITTWQSVFRLGRDWFDQFDLVIVDETHGAKAKSVTGILEKMNCEYRYGFTGTLDGKLCNMLVIQGLLGPIYKATTTSELMENKHVADLSIKAIVLHYPEEIKALFHKVDYDKEMDLIVRSELRNNFIKKLALSLKGNTLIICNFVDKHAEPLFQLISKDTEKPIYYVSGKVKPEERDALRKKIEKETESITIATHKSFATGTNIVKIDNIIFTSPSKAKIGTLQAIGRALRRSKKKTKATLYDIADNLVLKKSFNHTLRHFHERLKIYQSENFRYKIFNFHLNGKDKK